MRRIVLRQLVWEGGELRVIKPKSKDTPLLDVREMYMLPPSECEGFLSGRWEIRLCFSRSWGLHPSTPQPHGCRKDTVALYNDASSHFFTFESTSEAAGWLHFLYEVVLEVASEDDFVQVYANRTNPFLCHLVIDRLRRVEVLSYKV